MGWSGSDLAWSPATIRNSRGMIQSAPGMLSSNLAGVRLHDLRHTYASFGAGGGLGLPIIGRLLGHTQAATTARYAHLDNDPLRRASETIAGQLAAALDGNRKGSLVPLRRKGSR